MKKSRQSLMTMALLLGGMLTLADIARADPEPGTKPADKGAPPAQKEFSGQITGPLLLDTTPTARKNGQPDPLTRPIRQEILIPPSDMHVGLDILSDGRPMQTISYAGKTYLPVPNVGSEFHIRVWNHGPRRIVAVVSVDGLSVLNGKPASETQTGYVVAPYSHIVIKGWRRNLETVAAFRFVERERSYAALVGKPENLGVIGLIAIEEQVWHPRPALEKRYSGPLSARRLGEVGSIGTEYGRDVDSRAYYVPFIRSANRRTITVYYDTVAALREAGVPVDRTYPIPFPGDQEFVPPPPGFSGK